MCRLISEPPDRIIAPMRPPRLGQSKRNRGVEREAISLLLDRDARFQLPDRATKQALLAQLDAEGSWSAATFDLIMTSTPRPPLISAALTSETGIRLVEVKSTRKAIADARLGGFFFGATEREYALAEYLGSRFLFAFVILNSKNVYGRPFAVLLTLAELERKTRQRRVQFQVNLHSQREMSLLEPFEAPLGQVVT